MRHGNVVTLLLGSFMLACTDSPQRPRDREMDAAARSDAASITDGAPAADAADAATPGDAGECVMPPSTACPDPKLRYPDVEPIFKQRCLSCHDGADAHGPWPLTEYLRIASWWDAIQSDLRNCTMPPPGVAPPLALEERAAILTWIECGVLE
jgi:hypothetical protein